MRKTLQSLAAAGFVFAVAISSWSVLVEPNLRGFETAVKEAARAQAQDARCAPRPVKFPCLQKADTRS